MTQAVTGVGQELITPSFSDLSLQSASSGHSWHSPSSPSSRKHSLELSFSGSPRPKRLLLAEKNSATASLRYSAPCVQSNFDIERGDGRRGGILRRSATPIQSYISAKADDETAALPPISSFCSEWEKPGEISSHALLDPFRPQSQPSHSTNITSAPLEQWEVRKKKRYPFWRLTSPRIVESTIPSLGEGDQNTISEETSIAELKSNARAACMNKGWPEFATDTCAVTDTRFVVSTRMSSEDQRGPRLDALHTLEGTHNKSGSHQHDGNGRAPPSEENPITMCGRRQYSDWTGPWGRLNSRPRPFPGSTHGHSPVPIEGVRRRVPGAGALFPEGYQPRAGDPTPWICPIRDCQTVFTEAWALGGHFSVSRLRLSASLGVDLSGALTRSHEGKSPGLSAQ